MIVEGMEGWRTANSKEFEGIGCLSTKERLKRTTVQLYNHYSTIPLFMSAIVQNNNYINIDFSLYLEGI